LSEARLERKNPKEPNSQGEGDWETVNSYFNQSPAYVQGGQALHANLPLPGQYRVVISGAGPTDVFTSSVDFTKEKGWPDPGQVGYKVTNMKFWEDLKPFAKPGLAKITAGQIAHTNSWKRKYDTIVITNKVYPSLALKLRKWVNTGGNVVLTDEALKMLEEMKMIDAKTVDSSNHYAGYVNFATVKKENTYNDKLSKKIDQPGAAEGGAPGAGDPPPGANDEVHRRQTYEPVPLNLSIQSAGGGDANNSPVWWIPKAVYGKARGKQRAVGSTGDKDHISYGEIKWGKGRIRFHGALLPMPTDKFDNPFGVANYGLTYAGYQMLQNLLTWTRP
jgi:hypothetical protein